jgi:mannose-6-phosphate isomerase-like protein (cupin superfamily)
MSGKHLDPSHRLPAALAKQVFDLGKLELVRTCAHGGSGEILFQRPLSSEDFEGPWRFVDYAVLPPGTSIGVHTHGDDEELYIILEGSGTMHLDGSEFRVGPGAVVLNRRFGTHGLRNDGEVPLRLVVVEVSCGGERDEGGEGDEGGRP